MHAKVGRFDAYTPDINLFDVILAILSRSLPKRGMKFSSPLPKIHDFFFKMKKSYPVIFEDVHFRESPDYRYSKEIADCFIELQEAGYLTRPNPSLSMYRIDADLSEDTFSQKKPDHKTMNEIAELFNKNFTIIYDEQRSAC